MNFSFQSLVINVLQSHRVASLQLVMCYNHTLLSVLSNVLQSHSVVSLQLVMCYDYTVLSVFCLLCVSIIQFCQSSVVLVTVPLPSLAWCSLWTEVQLVSSGGGACEPTKAQLYPDWLPRSHRPSSTENVTHSYFHQGKIFITYYPLVSLSK